MENAEMTENKTVCGSGCGTEHQPDCSLADQAGCGTAHQPDCSSADEAGCGTADQAGCNADYRIREMSIEDYPEVYELWMSIRGFGIRSIDDSREGVERFIRRNPSTSVVAECGGRIVGSILCGHDGRRGCFYHVCVHEKYRKRGIGKSMAVAAMKALQAEKVNKVCLIAFSDNEVGNMFWRSVGWTFRQDLNYYDFVLNEENITRFNAK